MKLIISFLLIAICTTTKGQINFDMTRTVHYKSGIILETVKRNFLQQGDTTVFSKTIGLNVNIYIDIISRKCTLTFQNSKNEDRMMEFDYISDYYVNNEKKDSMYLMSCSGTKLILLDWKDNLPFNLMFFIFEKDPAPNYTHFFGMTGIEKVK